MTVKVFPSALKLLRSQIAENIDDAGEFLTKAIKEKIGIQGPPPSSPGEPPHIDHGDLIKSYDHSTDARLLTSHVGSTEPYSYYLEEGTDRTAPRPHIISTLIEQSDELARRICDS